MKTRIAVLISMATFVLGVGVGARYASYHPDPNLPNAQNESDHRQIRQPKQQILTLPEPARESDTEGSPIVESHPPEVSSDGPTSEELSVIRELKRRSREGEYVLASDNPLFCFKPQSSMARTALGGALRACSLIGDIGFHFAGPSLGANQCFAGGGGAVVAS